MVKIVVLYHSTYGHTEVVAKSVVKGIERVSDTEVALIKASEAESKLDILHNADAIIFGSPTYMGSVASVFKKFMEETSKFWTELKWKDKIAAGFTNSGSQSGDKLNTLIDLAIFAAQHGMIWVSTGLLPGNNSSTSSVNDINRIGSFLGVMTQANVDQGSDVAPPPNDLETAALLGQRVAEITKRFK
ncbi:MAG: flavodoxin family protein [Desulfuromonadales bacterium]|nr:flavodoxin family protein [Desulfuromonadales bacterium]